MLMVPGGTAGIAALQVESPRISTAAIAWAQDRGISAQTLELLGVGSGTTFFPDLERKSEALFFRYDDGWKARSFPEKSFVAGKGFKLAFWNLARALAANPAEIYVVEGELDACALVEAGVPPDRILSVPNGAKTKPVDDPKEARGYAYVEEALAAGLRRAKKFVWCGDSDDSGHALRADMVRLLGAARFWFVDWPEGCKDANDLLKSDGPEALLERVTDGAQQWPVQGLYRLFELPEPAPLTLWRPGFAEWESRVMLAPRTLSVVTGHPGHGKALALDTPIPTPAGWTTMGDISVGDRVFDEAGTVCRVTMATEVMLGHPCYRVEFDDGSDIVADADHLWETHKANGRATRPASLVTTREIANSIMDNGKRNHAIVLSGAITCAPADLLIPPYTLGAWLGDGASMGAIIHSRDPEIIKEIQLDGFRTEYKEKVLAYRIYGLNELLRFEELLGNKQIPWQYLRSSAKQRLALLQGLMDTDGHITSEAAGFQCEYVSVKKELADGVLELVLSLGIKARMVEGRATIDGRDCGKKFRILFRTKQPVFRLPRKMARLNAAPSLRIKHRYVVSCEVVTSVPVRCIQVDSQSHLYLAGRSFVPTHNTALWCQIWFQVVRAYGIPACVASFETRAKPHLRRQLRTLLSGKLEKDMTEEERDKADYWINDRYLFLVHPDQRPTLEWLLDMAEIAVVRHGARIIQVDPWNRVEAARTRDETETEYIGRCLRTLHVFAHDMNCHVQIVAHPAKMDSVRRGSAPGLEDISGSKNWENMVDQGFVVYRKDVFDGVNRKTECDLMHRKARFDELGYPCKLQMDYQIEFGRYVSLDYKLGGYRA